jgi:hypothetical protein
MKVRTPPVPVIPTIRTPMTREAGASRLSDIFELLSLWPKTPG